jgi:hypothetical protein
MKLSEDGKNITIPNQTTKGWHSSLDRHAKGHFS